MLHTDILVCVCCKSIAGILLYHIIELCMQNCTCKSLHLQQKTLCFVKCLELSSTLIWPVQCCRLRSPIWAALWAVLNSCPTVNAPDAALEWTDFQMFSKSATEHKACQVHHSHYYSRGKTALALCLKLTVPWRIQGRNGKGIADRCGSKTPSGSLPRCSLLASQVLLLLDPKLITIKRRFRYLSKCSYLFP